MGCNGSKLDVANGNTTNGRYSLLRRRKSDVSGGGDVGSRPPPSAPEPDSSSVKNSEAKKEEKTAEVKEIKINAEKDGEKKEGKDGKEVSKDSPDSFFSSKKEEENVASASGEANEFYSPMNGKVADRGDGKEVGEAAKTDGQDDKGVIGVTDAGHGGKKGEGDAELKEPILMEPTTILERVIAGKEKADAEEMAVEKQTTADSSAKGP